MGGFITTKEAVMKVLGEGWPRIPWTDIEVIHDERNRPFVALKGEGLLHMEQSNFESVQISITHDELIDWLQLLLEFPESFEEVKSVVT